MICFKEEKEIINIWEEGELEVLDGHVRNST